MSYTEYLDIIVRNSRQLGLVDKRIQRIRDNLEAISGRPLQAAVGGGAAQAARPSAAAQLDSRDLRAVQQTSRRQTARDRVRLPAPTRRIQDALQHVEEVLGNLESDAAARINDVADQVGQAQSRGRRRGRSFRQQVGTVRAENRFAAGYGATDRQAANEVAVREQRRQNRLRAQYDVPLPPKRIAVTGPRATGTIARSSQLRTARQQFLGQQLAAQQVGGDAIRIAERTSRIYRKIGGRRTQDLGSLTAIGRETRAGAERQRRTNQNRNSRQLGIGERGDLLRRSQNIVPRLPEGQQEEARRRVAEGLLANRRALREGRTVAARFERDRVRQFLTRKERGLAEEGRAETRARVPAKAGRLANRAEKLAAQANQIDIQRGTPLGDELFGKSADIASAATKQRNALRKSVVSGKATTKSVNEATDSLAELQSAFDTLKVRAGGMQKTAKEAAAKTKEAENAIPSAVRRARSEEKLAAAYGPQLPPAAKAASTPKQVSPEALASRAESLSRRAERIVDQSQFTLQDPGASDALKVRARQAGVIAQGTLNKLKAQEGQLTSEVLKTEKDKLDTVNRQISGAKRRSAIEAKQQKAQREGVSFGSFKKNIGRVAGGKGDTQDFESLALGAGFPLLFGGGPGSVAGGLLGSFVGKGFGGQILGGAIGQIVDDLIGSTAKLGNALSLLTDDFNALRTEGIQVSAALELQIKERKAAGDFAGAQAQIGAQVASGQVEGAGAQGLALTGVTAQVNALSASWDRVYKTVGLTVGVLASPFLATLSLALEIVNGIFREINGAVEGIAQLVNLVPGAADFFKNASQSALESTPGYQQQLAEIQAANDELVRRGVIEQGLDRQRTAATGLTGGNKVRADAQIAAKEKELALDEEIRKIKESAPLNEKLFGKTAQTVGIKQEQFKLAAAQEAARTELNAAQAQRDFARQQVDQRRTLNRETEALIRREEDLGNAQIDQARQEFDLQRSIADFRIRTEDQIASKRADLIRQELEISKIRGQISDSQLTSRFDNQIEAAPNDQAAKILSAAKEEALARKDLERTIRDGRIETSLKVDQIERSSRQEQRALENDRIALERQRDSVIRSRVSLERQTEDLKRDTADYQLNVARQIEDSAIRAAAAMRAGAEGLLGGAAGAAGGGPLSQEVLSGFDRIKGATSFRTKGTSGVRGAISPNGGNEYFDFNGATREAVASRIATWTKADWVSAINTALGEGKPGADVYNVIANIAARSAKEPSARVADLVTRPQQYVANAKAGLNINNISDPAFGKKLFGARFDQLLNQIGSGSGGSTASSIPYGGRVGQPVEYLTGDRNFRGNGKNIRYDEAHGGGNYHEHIAFKTTAERDAAMSLLKANGINIGSVNRPGDPGYHGSQQAFDVPAAGNSPVGGEQELSRRVRAILGIQGSGAAAPSRAALPGVSVGTAPFDLKAQAARDAQVQRDREKANEDLKREELRRREEDTLRAVVGKDSIVRKREELTLATRIADAGLQSTDTEQKLLELRIASTRAEEILVETVAELGPLTAKRAEALRLGTANLREQLAISEGLLKIERERQILSDLQSTQKEIQNFATGIDAGFGVGTQASSAYGNVISQGGTQAQAKAQADAVRTLTLLQQTVQDAQAIGGSIGDGIQNALIAAVTGGDIQQAFSAMFATIGNTLIQSALRPIEESITNAAFALLRPNLTQENLDIAGNVAKQQEAVAAASLNAAGTQLGIAAFQLQTAASQLASNNIVSSSFGGSGGLGGLVGGLFSGAGPVSGAFGGGGLATDTITSLFNGSLTFAGGGNPPIGQPSIVGEAGPEVSVARGLSTIVSNGRSADLMDTLKNPQARDTGSSGPGDTSISYDGPVLKFNDEDYVRKDDIPKIVNQSVKQSHGYTRSRMRDSPAERRSFGMR